MSTQLLFLISLTRNRIEAINYGLGLPESEPSQYGLTIGVAVVAALCIAAIAALAMRKVRTRKLDDPHKLFLELCRAHGLTRSQRRVLVDLSNARKLKDPCLVLFDAGHWVLDPNTDQELCQSKYRSRLVAVQRLLFETEVTPPRSAKS